MTRPFRKAPIALSRSLKWRCSKGDRRAVSSAVPSKGAHHYIVSNALQPVSAATTVRVRKGKMSTTDGPFAETKEHLGGFILIDAKDLNEAIRVAAGIPLAKLGSIEVRPVKALDG